MNVRTHRGVPVPFRTRLLAAMTTVRHLTVSPVLFSARTIAAKAMNWLSGRRRTILVPYVVLANLIRRRRNRLTKLLLFPLLMKNYA